jgi:hypothetical protein
MRAMADALAEMCDGAVVEFPERLPDYSEALLATLGVTVVYTTEPATAGDSQKGTCAGSSSAGGGT